MKDRIRRLDALLAKVEVVPADWTSGVKSHSNGSSSSIEAARCERWRDLVDAWKEAIEWREISGDILAAILAVCASTSQAGNQLFLHIVGSPSGGKTTFCDAVLTSQRCHLLEHVTGFHSGWKTGNDDEDCSLVARINGKTLITPEGDVVMNNPRYDELMSQIRRLFDGSSAATFKNSNKDTNIAGLRTPWVMAITPKMLDKDHSQLGERFFRMIYTDPTEEEKRAIARRAFRTEMRAMAGTSNGTAASIMDDETRRAYAMTGGYVDWLRANAEELVPMVEVPDAVEDDCIDLAELTADLRARPTIVDSRKSDGGNDGKEMPYRLTRQYGRLARMLAVVLNSKVIGKDEMRIVKKAAFDTAHGKSLDLVRWMCCRANPRTRQQFQETGMMLGEIAPAWAVQEDKAATYLTFLRRIGVIAHVPDRHSHGLWRLTDRVYNLYTNITKD